MKNLLLFILLTVSSVITFGQDYTLLGIDAADDPINNSGADLKSFSYSMDETIDSLWFKIEFHSVVPGDLGLVFGVDTDLDPTNGLNWDSQNNMDLLPEVVFIINRNFIFPEILYGSANITLDQSITFGDNDSTIILNVPLSQLDADGQFNIVLGSSSFSSDINNRMIFDDLPETGFFYIDQTTPTKELSTSDHFNVYPNPSTDQFYLATKAQINIQHLQIYNSTGQLIQEVSNSDGTLKSIDCSDWPKGIYFLKADYHNRLISKVLSKI